MSSADIAASDAKPGLLTRVRNLNGDAWIMLAGVCAIVAGLVAFMVLPLYALLKKSVEGSKGEFVGLLNFQEYFASPGLVQSITNSLTIAFLTMIIACLLAFIFAYGLTRSCMPFKRVFRAIATIPILAPSLLPAISLIYLFGNQGMIKEVLLGESIYGPIGIMIAMVFYIFPHVMMIMFTALSTTDARLYEAAEALGTKPVRVFFTITLPGAIYGIVSAAVVAFTLSITDFGVPKVIGGQYNVLATDIYKQVIGQQNFRMGAVVGLLLLLPAIFAFFVDQILQRKQSAALSARAIPYQPRPNAVIDRVFLVICGTIAIAILIVIGVAFFASIATFWPYNLTPSFKNYDFDNVDGGGWTSFGNSLKMAGLAAVFGTGLVFLGAYLVEKTRAFSVGRAAYQFLALLPLAVPGLVLGLGYIFFFNAPGNPFNFVYGTMAILVMCTVGHFYSVAHLTAVTSLNQIDREFETASASLRVPFYRTFFRVTLPVCLPAVLDIAMYLFVNALTTVSAVIFLYSPQTTLASIAVLNMDDAGDVAPAAAMAMTLFSTAVVVRVGYAFATRSLLRATQAWRFR